MEKAWWINQLVWSSDISGDALSACLKSVCHAFINLPNIFGILKMCKTFCGALAWLWLWWGGSLTKIAILYSRFALWRGREETHPARTVEIISLGSGLGSTKFCAMWERVGWFLSAWLSCMGTFQTLRAWVCPYLLAPWYHHCLFHGNSQVCVSALLSAPSWSLCLRFSSLFGLFHLLFFACSGVWRPFLRALL